MTLDLKTKMAFALRCITWLHSRQALRVFQFTWLGVWFGAHIKYCKSLLKKLDPQLLGSFDNAIKIRRSCSDI